MNYEGVILIRVPGEIWLLWIKLYLCKFFKNESFKFCGTFYILNSNVWESQLLHNLASTS